MTARLAAGEALLVFLLGCGAGGGSSSSGGSGASSGSTGASSTSGGLGGGVATGSYSDDGPGAPVSGTIVNASITCTDVESVPVRALSFGFAHNPLDGSASTLTNYSAQPGSETQGIAGDFKVDFSAAPAVGTYSFSNVADVCAQFTHYYTPDGGADEVGSAYYDFQTNSAGFNCAGPDPTATQLGNFTLTLTSVAIANDLCTCHGSLNATLAIQDDPSDPTATGTLTVTF
jgi:hypothetical protein